MENNEVKNEQANNKAPLVNTGVIKEKAGVVVEKVKGWFNYYKDNIKTDKKLWAGSAGVVVVIILLIALLFANPSKGVVKKYAEAMMDSDAEAIVKITHKEVIDFYDDMFDDYEDFLKDSFSELEDEDTVYKEYEIESDYKVLNKNKTEDYAEAWDDAYGIDEDSVKEIRRYTVKFKVSYDGERETVKEKVLVAKIGGKWYFMATE